MDTKSKSFRDLMVWQKSHLLVLDVYKLTREFPKEEIYGLTSQLRRAACSIPANIAEGYARKGTKDKLRFYNIAAGSINEVSYFLELAFDLNYSSSKALIEKVEEVGKMLNGYSKAIEN